VKTSEPKVCTAAQKATKKTKKDSICLYNNSQKNHAKTEAKLAEMSILGEQTLLTRLSHTLKHESTRR
jgi:hypothetical protein